MPKVIDENKILRLNPHINRSVLRQSMLITKLLAESGVVVTDYNLASSFSHRRIRRYKASVSNTDKNTA